MSKVKPGLIALATAGVLATGAVLVPVAASAANNTVTPSATAAPSECTQRPAEEQLPATRPRRSRRRS